MAQEIMPDVLTDEQMNQLEASTTDTLPGPLQAIAKYTDPVRKFFVDETAEESYQKYKNIGKLPLHERLLETEKLVIGDVAKATPWLIAPPLSIAKGIVPGILSAFKFGLKSGGIIGASKLVEKALESGDILESGTQGLKHGAGGALVGGVLGLAAKPAKIIKKQAYKIIKDLSSVNTHAIDYALERPELLTAPQKSYTDIIPNIKEELAFFSKNAHESFDNTLKELISSFPEKTVDTSTFVEAIAEKTRNPLSVIKAIKNYAIKKEMFDIPLSAFDRLAHKQPITMDEARIINNVLYHISKDSAPIGGGLEGVIGSAKTALLNDMEKALPGLKPMNRNYAESIKLYGAINDIIKNDVTAENKLQQIGKHLLTGRGSKTSNIEDLARLNENILLDLKAAETIRNFENVGHLGGGLIKTAPFYMAGSILGGSTLGPLGGAGGALAGALVGRELESPESTRKIIDLLTRSRGTRQSLGKLLKVGAERIPRAITGFNQQ